MRHASQAAEAQSLTPSRIAGRTRTCAWAVVGTVALVVGAVALAATGVGLVADIAGGAILGAAEVGSTAAAVGSGVAAFGETTDLVATGAGAASTLLDGTQCVFHSDASACAGAIAGGVGAGFGAFGARLAASGFRSLSVAAGVHSFLYGAFATTVDGFGYSESRRGNSACSAAASSSVN